MLNRLISLPVLQNGKVVMLLGVGNKPENYTDRDVRAMQQIANLAWRIVSRRREATLRTRLSLAIEQTAESVIITDTAGKILYVNPAFERATGYTQAEVIGKQDAAFYRQMWNTLQRGEVWRGHFSNKSKDGTLFEEQATISALRAASGRVVELQLHSRPLMVCGDPGMIDQLLVNLAVNSRDAMPPGGKLVIATAATVLDAAAAERLGAEAGPGDYVCVSVSDTGNGIPPEVLPKIFEPFFTTKAVGKGTGLGLASVLGIVKQHKGGIDVDNRPGHGVTFKIFLPALAEPTAKTVSTPEPPPVSGPKVTILLVEDEDSARRLTRRLLESYGHRVLEAANGQEVLALWPQHRAEVDLLLTDMVMPAGLSGVELARRLQADQPGLKTIFVSGYSQEAMDGGLELQAGLNFIHKPYTPEQLLQAIQANQ